MGALKLCAVIPAYNSESTIALVVAQTQRHVDRVVVVNDGSTDQTARAARRAGAHLLGCVRNRGKGHALGMGFAYALSHSFEAVITLDADLQHDPREIPNFVHRFKHSGAGIIIGNRMQSKTAYPSIRYAPNWVGTRCFSWLTGQTILDSQCGYRLYHRKVLGALSVLVDGFEAESDLLLRAGRHGFVIDFVPISAIYHNGNGEGSYYRPIRDTYYICINFLKNWFWQRR